MPKTIHNFQWPVFSEAIEPLPQLAAGLILESLSVDDTTVVYHIALYPAFDTCGSNMWEGLVN